MPYKNRFYNCYLVLGRRVVRGAGNLLRRGCVHSFCGCRGPSPDGGGYMAAGTMASGAVCEPSHSPCVFAPSAGGVPCGHVSDCRCSRPESHRCKCNKNPAKTHVFGTINFRNPPRGLLGAWIRRCACVRKRAAALPCSGRCMLTQQLELDAYREIDDIRHVERLVAAFCDYVEVAGAEFVKQRNVPQQRVPLRIPCNALPDA